MKKFKLGRLFTLVCALLSFVMVFSIAACNTDEGGGGGGNGLSLNLTTLSLDVGTKNSPILVTSSVTEDVVWTSSDETKVTVEGSGNGKRAGLVTAVALGSATITATSGDKSATCIVTVVEAEKITITKDGTAVSSNITLSGKDATVQLAASSSRGHDIAWESDKPLIATVSDSGLVTAVATSGTAVISAKCAQHSDVVASATVVVGDGKDASYEIKQGDENGQYGNYNSNDNPGVWVYWNQFSNVAKATYEEGVVNLETVNVDEGAWWYNVQLFYTATANDTDVAGNALVGGTHYKVTFDLETTMGGHITVNGYPLEVAEGVNHCEAYYDHAATAFAMQLGVEGFGCDLTNATLKLSNIKWEVSEKVQLVAPTFSITDNTITITDSNPAGSVGSYTLNLYDGEKLFKGLTVTNGMHINSDTIHEGTYTGKLVANAANAHYKGAPEATSANATVTGTGTDIIYTMSSGGAGGAIKEIGSWTYWTESWVKFSGVVTNDVAKITFSNNSGNWYDTQMYFKVAGKGDSDSYSAKLHINNVPNDGRITVNGQVYSLTAGENVIDLTISGLQENGTSVTIVFGVNGENNHQEIQQATDLTVSLELV